MTPKTIILQLAKGLGLFALSRVLTRKATRILCYHGGSLGDEHLFNPLLFCQPGLLEQRLHWLKRKGFIPGSLNTLLQPKKKNLCKGIALIVTLDDGWYSTATDLLPLLARYGHQPVLYLATQVFASGAPVVDVCIRYLLWKSPLQQIRLAGFTPELNGLYALHLPAEQARFCTAAEQWITLFKSDVTACHQALERLALAMEVPAHTLNLNSRRFSYMQRDELQQAAQRGCHVELHGHVHQYHSGQSQRNRTDIETCRQHIVTAGFPTPSHYCYPSGEHDAQAPTMLAAIGVRSASTCQPGLVHSVAANQRYFLPRFLDGANITMIEFEAEMSGILEFIRQLVRPSST